MTITRIGYGPPLEERRNFGIGKKKKLLVRLSPVGDAGQSLMEPLWLYGECFMALALYPGCCPPKIFFPFFPPETYRLQKYYYI